MTISDLEKDLVLCKEHLETTNSRGTEIESFLTRFLLVHICGEYEKEIKKMVIERARQSGDMQLASYIEKSLSRTRNIKAEQIRGNILKRFSDDCLMVFDNKISGTESESRYNNIVTNRDRGAAHGGTIEISFDELLLSHEKAKNVLYAISEALR